MNVRGACLKLARGLRTALDRELAPFGLRTQQAAVLLRCCRHPGVSPSVLATLVGTDTAGVTGLIDQVEKRGLVIRRANPVDRRAVLVEPTVEGRALAPRLREVFEAVNDLLLAGFSARQAAGLEAMLAKAQANLDAQLAETEEIALSVRSQRRQRRPRAGAPLPRRAAARGASPRRSPRENLSLSDQDRDQE